MFLQFKDQKQDIMTFEFHHPYNWLNLFSLSYDKREEIKEEIILVKTKVVEIFEYEKNNNIYWDKAKLYKQVINKALPIMQVLYSGYLFLILFDNATSHSIYPKDTLQIKDMSKDFEEKQ